MANHGQLWQTILSMARFVPILPVLTNMANSVRNTDIKRTNKKKSG